LCLAEPDEEIAGDVSGDLCISENDGGIADDVVRSDGQVLASRIALRERSHSV
jgi:hypothetical protein